MVEGATTYHLVVSTDPSFGTGKVIDVTTPLNYYIPNHTLADDDYFWRVNINKGSVSGLPSEVASFSLSLPLPTNLHLIPDEEILIHPPTFCWDSIVENDPSTGYPFLAAWKYRLQVSKDPTFSTTYEQIDTEQTCYTPLKGYEDGTYNWRVSMLDGEGRMGAYSSTAQFTKQYPITSLVYPINESIASTPTFIWTPVDGAEKYRLEISQFSTFSPLFDSTTTINSRYTPTKSYVIDRPYYWRVAIIDADGKYGPFNDARIIIGTFSPGMFLPLIANNN
jgi:hypothetical protein